MFGISYLMRISLILGCMFNVVVEGQGCGRPRCVRFTYDVTEGSEPAEPTFDNVDSTCGEQCDTPFECDNLQQCIQDQTVEACSSCIDAAIEVANSTASGNNECGDPETNEDGVPVAGSTCLSAFLATAFMRGKTCCNAPDNPLCFSSMATADVENKGKTLVKDIQVGNKVLTQGNQYKTVYTVDHMDPDKQVKFVQIYSTANAESPLEVTENHMVFVHGKASPVPASAIKVGDALQTANSDSPSIVTKISSVERKGIWNPITEDGTIAVDGIVASSYNVAFRANDEAEVEVSGVKVMSHHDLVHLLMTPYRAVCLGFSLSFCETKDEFNGYSQLGNDVLKFGQKQSEAVQDFMIFVLLQLAFLCKLLSLAMNPVVATGLILGSGAYYFFAKKN